MSKAKCGWSIWASVLRIIHISNIYTRKTVHSSIIIIVTEKYKAIARIQVSPSLRWLSVNICVHILILNHIKTPYTCIHTSSYPITIFYHNPTFYSYIFRSSKKHLWRPSDSLSLFSEQCNGNETLTLLGVIASTYVRAPCAWSWFLVVYSLELSRGHSSIISCISHLVYNNFHVKCSFSREMQMYKNVYFKEYV